MSQRNVRKPAYYGQIMFFTDVQETIDRYGKYIPEFQRVFAKHDVRFGSPEDFSRLAPKLAYDDSFRTDFAALTKRVGREEEGRLSLTRMLTVVAIAMGGREVERIGSVGAVPVSLAVVYLAGIGGWSEKEEPALVGASASAQGHGEGAGAGEEEREAAALERRLASGTGEELESVAAALFSGPAMLKEALNRLEMNALQLKLHLDSLDSRMERIEPHLDDLAWRVATQTGSSGAEKTRNAEERWSRFAPEMKPWPVEREKDLAWGAKRAEPAGESSGERTDAVSGVDSDRVGAGVSESPVVMGAAKEPPAGTAVVPEKEAERKTDREATRERARAITREVVAGRETARWREAAGPLWESETLPEPVLHGPVLHEHGPVLHEPEPVLHQPEPVLHQPEPTEPVLQRAVAFEPAMPGPMPELVLREPGVPEAAIRVPFGEYLRDEDEAGGERHGGRWAFTALLTIAVVGGGLVYRNDGWQGFNQGWQQGKALAVAKGRVALDEAKRLWAKSAPAASATPSAAPAAGSGGESAETPASSVPAGSVPAGSGPAGSEPAAPAVPAGVVRLR